jgi:outer membrane protein OmpA-like peptidoglycan-associated protein
MKRIVLSALLVACAAISFSQRTAYYSKYDFVPGDKVIAYEDFSATEIGDFPLKWNTNATAEVVTLNDRPGKWLKINKESVFHPEFITSFPENFTLEFDLGVNEGWNSMPFVVNITKLKTPKEYTDYYHFVTWKGTHTIHMEFQPEKLEQRAGNSYVQAGKDGNHAVDNKVEFKSWNNGGLNFAHISIWRQKQRLRVYLNGEKIWDIPKVFDSLTAYNAVTLAMQGSYKLEDYYLLGNIRLAVGAPDTRNKLVREGKFVTRGILFSPNTDSLRPESFGALKDISNVLKENPAMKFKIVGHTDADGDDKTNMELSKRRAAAVKNALVTEFGIVADNLEIDGKGESAPVDKNTTVEGKANNRRVEFVKLK